MELESCNEKINFNPLPPCGGRLRFNCSHVIIVINFNPLPPCGGRLGALLSGEAQEAISIHSLRVEGDREILPYMV